MIDVSTATPSRWLLGLPPVRSIRARLAAALSEAAVQPRPLPIIAIGADGIDFTLAKRHWTPDELQALRAEMPATSSSGWLSALTGRVPVAHGALGAVQRAHPGASAGSVFAERAGPFVAGRTIFHDATAIGYRPVVLTADFAALDGPWRRAAFAGAELFEGPRLMAAGQTFDAAAPPGLYWIGTRHQRVDGEAGAATLRVLNHRC